MIPVNQVRALFSIQISICIDASTFLIEFEINREQVISVCFGLMNKEWRLSTLHELKIHIKCIEKVLKSFTRRFEEVSVKLPKILWQRKLCLLSEQCSGPFHRCGYISLFQSLVWQRKLVPLFISSQSLAIGGIKQLAVAFMKTSPLKWAWAIYLDLSQIPSLEKCAKNYVK